MPHHLRESMKSVSQPADEQHLTQSGEHCQCNTEHFTLVNTVSITEHLTLSGEHCQYNTVYHKVSPVHVVPEECSTASCECYITLSEFHEECSTASCECYITLSEFHEECSTASCECYITLSDLVP